MQKKNEPLDNLAGANGEAERHAAVVACDERKGTVSKRGALLGACGGGCRQFGLPGYCERRGA